MGKTQKFVFSQRKHSFAVVREILFASQATDEPCCSVNDATVVEVRPKHIHPEECHADQAPHVYGDVLDELDRATGQAKRSCVNPGGDCRGSDHILHETQHRGEGPTRTAAPFPCVRCWYEYV